MEVRLSGAMVQGLLEMLRETDVDVDDTLVISEGEMLLIDVGDHTIISAKRHLNPPNERWIIS